MNQLPKKLLRKLTDRENSNALRGLGSTQDLVDFSSNDYLGLSTSEVIFTRASEILGENNLQNNGASGSRLLSGNHILYTKTENLIADFHNAEAALIFNSGYDANVGFFSSVPQRGDLIFYDEFIHASIRDGISMSKAKGYKFKHSDFYDLAKRCDAERNRNLDGDIYIVTESVFSMDGDTPDLKMLCDICSRNNYHLVVDEAHAIGVVGQGRGVIQEQGLESLVFARIVTFGKALGCHGAGVLGSIQLKTYLINFARSLIYTTALPPHSVASIKAAYELIIEDLNSGELQENDNFEKKLNRNIAMLRFYLKMYTLEEQFIKSTSAIHSCVIPGNALVKEVSEKLREKGFDVKAILAPTVPEGKERLRICLHSYNTEAEIEKLLKLLATFIK